MGDGIAQLFFVDVAAPCVAQIRVCCARVSTGQAFEPGIGPQTIETEQESSVQDIAWQALPTGDRGQQIRKASPQCGFFEHIEQARHRPAGAHFLFEAEPDCAVPVGDKRCDANRLLLPVGQEPHFVANTWHGSIQGAQSLAHVFFEFVR